MKKAIIVSGVLTIMIALLQSCAPNRRMPRPQRHPTPPGKFVLQEAPVQPTTAVPLVNA